MLTTPDCTQIRQIEITKHARERWVERFPEFDSCNKLKELIRDCQFIWEDNQGVTKLYNPRYQIYFIVKFRNPRRVSIITFHDLIRPVKNFQKEKVGEKYGSRD